jgi:CheY-like chemotaxis protein
MARKHFVFPLRDDYRTLYLATIDPNDLAAQQEVALASGRTIVLLVSTPTAVRSAIDAGYSVESPSGARRRAAAVATGLPGTAVAGVRPAIILVDDDAVIRALANVLLSKEGFDVTEVADGEAALEKLAADPEFALMVLDLGLPRIAGRDVLMRVRSDPALQRLPVVILTGSADESLEAALLDAGADDYLRKPIDPARFVARVKAVIRRAEQG